MKRANNFYRLFAALILIAAVLSCSKESQPLALEPETDVEDVKSELKTVSYSVSANQDVASTKVTINGNKHEFQSTDRLQITGGNELTGPITGLLTIQEGFTAQSAIFLGELTYEGEDPTISNPELTATLISEDSQLAGIDLTKAIASDLASAVHNYGILTATSAFNTRSFSFDQKCSFINFDLYAYGFQVGETVTVILSHKESGEEQTIASNTIEVSGTDGNEKAIFTAAILGGRTITSPTITISGTTQAGTTPHNVTIKRPFGGTTVVAKKVYKVVDKAPQIGGVYYSDGTWTGNRQTEGAYALGLIVYVNNDSSQFAEGVTEKSAGFGHGLVIAFSDCPITTNGIKWSTDKKKISPTSTPFEDWFTDPDRNALMLSSFDGIAKTDYMTENDERKARFPAATAARDYNNVTSVITGLNMSKWFMPTISQWIAAFKGLGNSGANFTYPSNPVTYNGTQDNNLYDNFNKEEYRNKGLTMLKNLEDDKDYDSIKCDDNDGKGAVDGRNLNMNFYWTSTQNLQDRALCIGFISNETKKGVTLAHQVKNRYKPADFEGDGLEERSGRQVRAFLAF